MIWTVIIVALALGNVVAYRAGKAMERANGLMRTALFMERREHDAVQR